MTAPSTHDIEYRWRQVLRDRLLWLEDLNGESAERRLHGLRILAQRMGQYIAQGADEPAITSYLLGAGRDLADMPDPFTDEDLILAVWSGIARGRNRLGPPA
jgi:hypothetical protein